MLANVVPFNADEAEWRGNGPRYFGGGGLLFDHGQAYDGQPGCLARGGRFSRVRPSVLAMRLLQVALYLGMVATTYGLGLNIYELVDGERGGALHGAARRAGHLTTVTLGGFGELLLIGNLSLWLALKLGDRPAAPVFWLWLLFGVLGGRGFGLFLSASTACRRQLMCWRCNFGNCANRHGKAGVAACCRGWCGAWASQRGLPRGSGLP